MSVASSARIHPSSIVEAGATIGENVTIGPFCLIGARVTIGDGSLMYNPLVPTLGLSAEQDLPLLILVFNNSQYAVMKHFHKRFYPDGTAVSDDDYYGVNIKGPDYEQAARMVGGYCQRVEAPADLPAAVEAAYASVKVGKTAILNLIMPGDGGVK